MTAKSKQAHTYNKNGVCVHCHEQDSYYTDGKCSMNPKTSVGAKEHTPTPWEVFDKGGIRKVGTSFKDKPLIFLETDSWDDAYPRLKPEDAAFIVRACNSYEELLEACKLVMRSINSEKVISYEAIKAIGKAITKAEAI